MFNPEDKLFNAKSFMVMSAIFAVVVLLWVIIEAIIYRTRKDDDGKKDQKKRLNIAIGILVVMILAFLASWYNKRQVVKNENMIMEKYKDW
jgi:heme/copper-type cytochrome/quinol oxidase subunit 2